MEEASIDSTVRVNINTKFCGNVSKFVLKISFTQPNITEHNSQNTFSQVEERNKIVPKNISKRTSRWQHSVPHFVIPSRLVPQNKFRRIYRIFKAQMYIQKGHKVCVSLTILRTCKQRTQKRFFWGDATGPHWARASFTRFLDHTQRGITVSRTPLDE